MTLSYSTNTNNNQSSGKKSFQTLRSLSICMLFGIAFCLATIQPVFAAQSDKAPRILAMGDSMFSANSARQKSVIDQLSDMINEPILDKSTPGARYKNMFPVSFLTGFNINSQYQKGNWDWVIINGGGNDLLFGCGCSKCTKRLNKLVSPNGIRGQIPSLVSMLNITKTRVIYVGYMRTPGVRSPIERCTNIGIEFERRLLKLAQLEKRMWFVSLANLVPYGDRSHHMFDMVHPSPKGSEAIAKRLAKLLKKYDKGS